MIDLPWEITGLIVLSNMEMKSASLYLKQGSAMQNTQIIEWLRKDVNPNFYLFAAACSYLNELVLIN